MPTIQKLHPTLKKCKCGFIGNRGQLYKHLEHEKATWPETAPEAIKTYFQLHGEVPINEDEGDKFLNAEWFSERCKDQRTKDQHATND